MTILPEHLTVSPNEEHAFSNAGVARVLSSQPNAAFMLLCPDGTWVPLPQPLIEVLSTASQAMVRKESITIIVRSAWVTTQEAADMMGYSRQVIVDLIKKRRLKASKLGSHRRIRLSDLLEYMNKEDKEAHITEVGLELGAESSVED